MDGFSMVRRRAVRGPIRPSGYHNTQFWRATPLDPRTHPRLFRLSADLRPALFEWFVVGPHQRTGIGVQRFDVLGKRLALPQAITQSIHLTRRQYSAQWFLPPITITYASLTMDSGAVER